MCGYVEDFDTGDTFSMAGLGTMHVFVEVSIIEHQWQDALAIFFEGYVLMIRYLQICIEFVNLYFVKLHKEAASCLI